MDTNLFKTLGEVAGIGGVSLGVMLLLVRQIISKDIFPRLAKPHAYSLLRLVIVLAWSVAIAGLLTWYLSRAEGEPGGRGSVDRSTRLPAESSLRVSYYSVGGHALDFLVHGSLDKKWEATLGGQPFIVPNDVYVFAKALIERYTLQFSDAFLTREADYSDPDENRARSIQGRSLFAGGFRLLALDSSATPEDFLALQDGSSSWNLHWTGKAPPQPTVVDGQPIDVNPEAYFFWRFLRRTDLAPEHMQLPQHNQTLVQLYQFITRDNFPADFAIVSASYVACAQAAAIMLTERRPMIRVAVLENVSPVPFRIGPIVWKEVTLRRLRSEDEDFEILNSAPTSEHNVFPAQLLAPGEKIVIPMRLLMAYEDRDLSFLPGLSGKPAERPTQIPDSITIPIQVQGGPNRLLAVSGQSLTTYLSKAFVDPGIQKAYVFGPSIKAITLEVEGTPMAIRQFDPRILVIKGGSGTGSCPYLFTYSPSRNQWQSEGPILYGFRNPEKEAWDRKNLTNFDGRLLIRELDAETSLIDALRVEIFCPGQGPIELLPKDKKLQQRDHNYLILHQGDSALVDFEGKFPRGCAATLHTYGYYVPSSDAPAMFNRF